MMSSPSEFSSLRLPLAKAFAQAHQQQQRSHPQAMPNMVRNERSLCAHSVRNIWRRISRNIMGANS